MRLRHMVLSSDLNYTTVQYQGQVLLSELHPTSVELKISFNMEKERKIWEVTKLKSVNKVVNVCFFFVFFFRCHKNLHTP